MGHRWYISWIYIYWYMIDGYGQTKLLFDMETEP